MYEGAGLVKCEMWRGVVERGPFLRGGSTPGPPGGGGVVCCAGGGGGAARGAPGGGGGGGGGVGGHFGAPHVHMTDAWGIADGYHDALGEWRVLSTATREALRRAMGAEGDAPPPAPVIVGRAGERVDIAAPARLVLGDGAALA